MAKSKKSNASSKKVVVRQRPTANSTPRSGPSVLTPPLVNLASNAGRQSEIALPVRKGLSTLTIHPDNTRWLGEAAPSFQRWGMTDLTLFYEPRVATSVNGQIAIAFLSDFADRSPDSLEDTVTLSGAQRGAPWSKFQLPKQRNRLFDYCSLSDFDQGDATTMNDRSPGRIVVWADMDSAFGADDVVGWVYISYKPVLQQPILRKLQVAGGGGTLPTPTYPVPTVPGQSGYRLADYYYKERAYTTAYDFLGLNPNYNNEVLTLTPRIGYVYSDKLGYNAVVNTSSSIVRLYFDVILRDFSLFSTPKSLDFKTWGTTLFAGNKGSYVAWANGDVCVRVVGDIEPNGWFYLDNSIITSWKQSETYIFELGLENGVYVPPLKQPTFDWGVTAKKVTLTPEVTAASGSVQTSKSFKLGATTRNSNYVGFSGPPSNTIDLGMGATMLINSGADPTSMGTSTPTNRLGAWVRNDTGADGVFHISMIISDFNTSYATTGITAFSNGGTIYDSITSSNNSGPTIQTTTVSLPAGKSVSWSLALRSSSFNGSPAVESMGVVYMTVARAPSLWAQL